MRSTEERKVITTVNLGCISVKTPLPVTFLIHFELFP